MLGLSARWAGIVVLAASACGGATAEKDLDSGAEGGAATGDAPTGGFSTGGTEHGGAPGPGGAEPPEPGDPSEGGAGGAPSLPPLGCPSNRGDFEWNGPFVLTFSDTWLSRQQWTDDGPICTVLASDTHEIDGKRSIRIDLACTTDGASVGEIEPIDFDLSIDFGRLPASSWRPLEIGSIVELQYGYLSSIFRPIQHFLLVATDATPGFDAGAPVLGGFDGSEFRNGFELGPIAVSLGPALCTEPGPLECLETSSHDFVVTFHGATASASLGTTVLFDTDPPLALEVTGNTIVTSLEFCCYDCEDDWVSFGVWAPAN